MRAIARQEAQGHMNEFLSIISHDLKTPLTSIKGNIQLIGRRLTIGTTGQEEMPRVLLEAQTLIKNTDQQVNRVTRLVNSLLESSRIYANTMDLLFELCELNTLLNEAVREQHYIPAERTLNLDILEDQHVLVMADASRIKNVVFHYLSNAHKFSSLDKPIEVSLREDGRMARVQVRDEGPGIPLEEQKHIWERFYRVANIDTLNGSEVGLGLGLHICHTVIEQHRGQFGVKSAPGEGSTFWFTLPLFEQSLGNGQGIR